LLLKQYEKYFQEASSLRWPP